MFGSIVIQKQQVKNPHRLRSLDRYDILYKKKFNPNEEETVMFREGVEKEHLGVYLASLCKFFYEQDGNESKIPETLATENESDMGKRIVYQCRHCYTVYDPEVGDALQNIAGCTGFEALPDSYCCPLCEAPKEAFAEIDEKELTKIN
jgi:rubredoxin